MMSRLTQVLLLASFCILADTAIVRCGENEKGVSVEASDKTDASAQAEDSDKAPDRKLPQLKPGQWEPLFEMGESIYPSVVVSTATIKDGMWDDEGHLGDNWGLIGIAVRGMGNDCPVKVEISGGNFVKPSTFTGTLPKKDTVYCVYPELKYDYEKLLGVKQTVPEMLSFKVKVGNRAYPEKTVRVQVRPINECVFYFMDSSGNNVDTSFLFAAYVNENHPMVSQIMKEALASQKVDSFTGYSDDRDSVLAEIEAIWDALRNRGVRYATMTASADDDNPYIESQYVRLLGESVNYSQANCVDGSVLMASIFRKMGLNASLIEVPEHMFVGVDLDSEGKETAYIETTDLGDSEFEEALEAGRKEYGEGKDKFNSDKPDEQDYNIINIQAARVMGIMPIKDSSAS